MWANEVLLILVSIFLTTWGSTYLRMKDHIDITLGFSCLITSFILLFFGVTKLLEEIALNWNQYIKISFYIGGFIFWVISFHVGRSHWSRRLLHGSIQIAVIMPLVFWLIARDAVYSWQDTFLYLALTFWISVMAFRKNASMTT